MNRQIDISPFSKSRDTHCRSQWPRGLRHEESRAIAQAVSRWLPTAAARVQTRVWSSGIVVDKVALGQVFSEYFSFPCQSSCHQILHHHNHPGQVQ
jgi:hypothetical protein